MKIRQFDETYSGWGTETRGGRAVGLSGYSKQEAEEIRKGVENEMRSTRGIIDVNVYVEEMPNGNWRVVNRSTYGR